MPRKKKTVQQQGKGVYDRVANKLFGANLRDGEIHSPQYVNGKLKFASFMGPGSDVFGRIRDKTAHVSESDLISMMHDLRYSTAKNAADVRYADTMMIKKLREARATGKDNWFNTYLGQIPIMTKNFAEDWNIIKKGSFSSMKGIDNKEDQKLADDTMKPLIQQGYGKKKTATKPNAWRLHVATVKAKNKTMKYSDVLRLASSSYKKK